MDYTILLISTGFIVCSVTFGMYSCLLRRKMAKQIDENFIRNYDDL